MYLQKIIYVALLSAIFMSVVFGTYGQVFDSLRIEGPEELVNIIKGLHKNYKHYYKTSSNTNSRIRNCSPVEFYPWKSNNRSGSTIFKYPHVGNVGIGTCEPKAKVHVVGDAINDKYFLVDEFVPGDTPEFPPGLVTKFSVVRSMYNSYIASVGINTREPVANLDIRGNSFRVSLKEQPFQGTPEYYIFLSEGSNSIYSFYVGDFYLYSLSGDFYTNSVNGNYYINKYTNSPVIFGSGGIDVSIFGRLGVGTVPSSAPGYNVVVCGKIKCTELRVEPSGWCDYKFKGGYSPKPFAEFVKYYRKEHHLPGVPSEEDVMRDGVHVGEVIKGLLSNLEDAYLYIEELEKRVTELEKKVEELSGSEDIGVQK